MPSHVTRRIFLRVGAGVGAAAVLAPVLGACDKVSEILGDATTGIDVSGIDVPDVAVPDVALPDVSLPGLAERELGDAHFVWDLRTGASGLYRIDAKDGVVASLASDARTEVWRYGGTPETLNFPVNVVIAPDGGLHVMDFGNRRVVRLGADGKLLGTIDGLPAAVRDGVVDGDGVLWVVSPTAHQVLGLASDGSTVRTIGAEGEGDGQVRGPRGVALDPDGDLHVVDTGNGRVVVFDRQGAWKRNYGSFGRDAGQVMDPRSIAIDPLGNSYVADPVGGALQIFAKDGTSVARVADLKLGDLSATPLEVAFTPTGVLYVRLYAWRA